MSYYILTAQELEIKGLKVKVNEKNGRFHLTQTLISSNQKNFQEIPLLNELKKNKVKFNSYTLIRINKKDYIFGKNKKTWTAKGLTNGVLTFGVKIKDIVIRQKLSFIRPQFIGSNKSLFISYEIINISKKNAEVGLKIILDIPFYQKKNIHFHMPGISFVKNEMSIKNKKSYIWYTFLTKSDEPISVKSEIGGTGFRAPDELVFAAMKKLKKTKWKIPYKNGSSFSKNPGVAVIFYVKKLEPGESDLIGFTYGPTEVQSHSVGNLTINSFGNLSLTKNKPLWIILDFINSGRPVLNEFTLNLNHSAAIVQATNYTMLKSLPGQYLYDEVNFDIKDINLEKDKSRIIGIPFLLKGRFTKRILPFDIKIKWSMLGKEYFTFFTNYINYPITLPTTQDSADLTEIMDFKPLISKDDKKKILNLYQESKKTTTLLKRLIQKKILYADDLKNIIMIILAQKKRKEEFKKLLSN